MTDSLRLQFGMAELNFEQRNFRQAALILEGVLEEVPALSRKLLQTMAGRLREADSRSPQ